MRRLMLACILICLMCAAVLPAAAQDTVSPAGDILAQAEAAVARAEAAAAEAERYANDASNFLGIFESVGVVIGVFTGILVPLVAIVGGFIGIRRLGKADQELAAARAKFEHELGELRASVETELRQKQAELDALKAELEASAKDERVRSEEATIALSMLPLAERQYRVQDFDGALDTYRRALALDPTNAVIHYRLGYVYTQTDQLDEATEHLNKALEIDPRFALALANLGHVMRRRAEKLPTNDPERGRLLAEAELKLRQALELSPKLVDEDGESWWGSLGGLHRRRGQLDDAIDAYRRASEVTPAASYPVANLALLHLQKGDQRRMRAAYQRAEWLADRAVLADGRDFWGWADKLVAQLALRKYDEAKMSIEWLLMAAPEAAPGSLGRPLETLNQIAQRATPDEVARLRPFIERIETHIKGGKQQPVAEQAVR